MPYGKNYLKSKLASKQHRVDLRYKCYEMKHYVKDLGISTPPSLRAMQSTLGWCAKAVDSLADRLQVYSFANDVFDMQTIFNMNNPSVLYDSAILGALIASCSFIYVSADKDGFPRLQVIDGNDATGIMDPISGFLSEGYAVLTRDENGSVTSDAYFTHGYTEFWSKEDGIHTVFNSCAYPLLVPIIYRPDARRPFGHSRISRACIDLVSSASRTIKRSEISAEFYSFPQKYLLGVSEDVEIEDKWKASMSALLTITKDDDGDHPVIGQFQQQSMNPHMDQLRMFASLFAAETGLTIDDLGFPTENPSSAEAIKSQHENLRLMARKAQRNFGYGFIQAGYLASCLANNLNLNRSELYRTKILWEPIFEPDYSTLSAMGDGIIKINNSVPGYIGSETLRRMTGIEGEN